MALTKREMYMASVLLSYAAEKFSNHGCNDFDLINEADMDSREDRLALKIAMAKWGGDRELVEHLTNELGEHQYTDDWALMSYLSARCLEESE